MRVVLWALLTAPCVLVAACGSDSGTDSQEEKEAVCETLMDAFCSKLVECQVIRDEDTGALFDRDYCATYGARLVSEVCLPELQTTDGDAVDACRAQVAETSCPSVCADEPISACDGVLKSKHPGERHPLPCASSP